MFIFSTPKGKRRAMNVAELSRKKNLPAVCTGDARYVVVDGKGHPLAVPTEYKLRAIEYANRLRGYIAFGAVPAEFLRTPSRQSTHTNRHTVH